MTTTRVTHASPAGTYAKVAERYWENDAEVKKHGFDTDTCPDIAHQLVHNYPGTHFKVGLLICKLYSLKHFFRRNLVRQQVFQHLTAKFCVDIFLIFFYI